jgi:hypothetical protein
VNLDDGHTRPHRRPSTASPPFTVPSDVEGVSPYCGNARTRAREAGLRDRHQPPALRRRALDVVQLRYTGLPNPLVHAVEPCLRRTQNLFDDGYEKPFLSVLLLLPVSSGLTQSLCRVTYLNTSAFALYLIPYVFRRIRRRRESPDEGSAGRYAYECSGCIVRNSPSLVRRRTSSEYAPLVEDEDITRSEVNLVRLLLHLFLRN